MARSTITPDSADELSLRLTCGYPRCPSPPVKGTPVCRRHLTSLEKRIPALKDRPPPQPNSARSASERFDALSVMRNKAAQSASLKSSRTAEPNGAPHTVTGSAQNSEALSSARPPMRSPPESPTGSGSPLRKRPRLFSFGQNHYDNSARISQPYPGRNPTLGTASSQEPLPDGSRTNPTRHAGSPDSFQWPRQDASSLRNSGSFSRETSSAKTGAGRENGVNGVARGGETTTGQPAATRAAPLQQQSDSTINGRYLQNKTSGGKMREISSLNHQLKDWFASHYGKRGKDALVVATAAARVVEAAAAPVDSSDSSGSETRRVRPPLQVSTPKRNGAASAVRQNVRTPGTPQAQPLDPRTSPKEQAPRPTAEGRRAKRAEGSKEASLDSWIYQQSDCAPPAGVELPPKDPEPEPEPADLPDAPHFAHIDPRIHWTRQRSGPWLEAKQLEIKARGGRKANFGKAAERLAQQRRKQAAPKTADLTESLPEDVRDNEAWVGLLKGLEQLGDKRASTNGRKTVQRQNSRTENPESRSRSAESAGARKAAAAGPA